MQELLKAALSQKSSKVAKPTNVDEVISLKINLKACANEDKRKIMLTPLKKESSN
jgi:hypothetical protein